MFCQKCGGQVNNGSAFCPNCGVAVIYIPQEQPPVETTADEEIKPAKKANFVTDILEKIKGSPKLQIGIAAGAAVLVIAVVIVLIVASCGNKTGAASAEEAFDMYINAQKNLDAEELIALAPPDLYDYYFNKMKEPNHRYENGASDSEAKEYADRMLGKNNLFIPHVDFSKYASIRELDYINTPEFVKTAECDNVKTYVASSREVRELNEYVKNKFEFKNDITGAVLYKFDFSFTSIGGTEFDFWHDMKGVFVEINDRWYYIEEYLINGNGMNNVDRVDWMAEWYEQ